MWTVSRCDTNLCLFFSFALKCENAIKKSDDSSPSQRRCVSNKIHLIWISIGSDWSHCFRKVLTKFSPSSSRGGWLLVWLVERKWKLTSRPQNHRQHRVRSTCWEDWSWLIANFSIAIISSIPKIIRVQFASVMYDPTAERTCIMFHCSAGS